MRDATNLAWKLAAVTRWGAPDELLASYEPERRPHASALIRMALRIGHFMQPGAKLQAALSQGLLRSESLIPAARDDLLQLRFKPRPDRYWSRILRYGNVGSGVATNGSWRLSTAAVDP